jgi:class 3 adenylate cyclase
MRPETRYAKSGDVNIAYQIVGDGPIDLVLVPGFVSHLDLDWEDSGHAHFLGARVAAAAASGEVLVSGTVRDLVAGSGIEFEDRGEHELKGIAEPRHLYAVTAA